MKNLAAGARRARSIGAATLTLAMLLGFGGCNNKSTDKPPTPKVALLDGSAARAPSRPLYVQEAYLMISASEAML